MTEQTADPATDGRGDTRAGIIVAARELFIMQGYQRTSLRQIAERLGVTKAAVLYHFPSKHLILAELSEPMVAQLEAVLVRAAARPPAEARRAVLEGMLDAYIEHRSTLLMLRHDLAILTQQPALYQRFFALAARAYELVAGPDADLLGKVEAAQALAALGDPVLYFADEPVEDLRAAILAGAQRYLRADGSAETPASGQETPTSGQETPPEGRTRLSARPHRVGRPRALDGERLATARRMYEAGRHSVTEIAKAVGVSRATLYRHLADPSSETVSR